MCEKCRFVSRTAAITTQPGVSSIELITDILRAEGWPKYVNPRTIAIEHAHEFTGTGIATTAPVLSVKSTRVFWPMICVSPSVKCSLRNK